MFELIKGIVYWKEECKECKGSNQFVSRRRYGRLGISQKCPYCEDGHLLEEVKPEKPQVPTFKGFPMYTKHSEMVDEYNTQLKRLDAIEEALKVEEPTTIVTKSDKYYKYWMKAIEEYNQAQKLLSSLYWDGEIKEKL